MSGTRSKKRNHFHAVPETWQEDAAEREERRAALKYRARICPTPWKHAYLTQSDADRDATRTRRGVSGLLNSYLCPCDLYHHTSSRGESRRYGDIKARDQLHDERAGQR